MTQIPVAGIQILTFMTLILTYKIIIQACQTQFLNAQTQITATTLILISLTQIPAGDSGP